MIEICYFLVKILTVVHFCKAENKTTDNLDINKTGDLIPDIYNIYMEALAKDEDTMTRRVLRDRKLYTIHIAKLKDVNGIKNHNLIVTDDSIQGKEPIMYINNPVESHLPYTYLSEEQFKNDLLKKLQQQREEFKEQQLKKQLNKFLLFNQKVKQVHAIVKETVIPQADKIVLKDFHVSGLSRTRRPNKKENKHKNHRTVTEKIDVTDAVDTFIEVLTENFTRAPDESTTNIIPTENVVGPTITSTQNCTTVTEETTTNIITTTNVVETTVTTFSDVVSTITERSLTEATTKINVETTTYVTTTNSIPTTIPLEVVTSVNTEATITVNTEPEETTTTVTTTIPTTTTAKKKKTPRKKQGRPYVFMGQ